MYMYHQEPIESWEHLSSVDDEIQTYGCRVTYYKTTTLPDLVMYRQPGRGSKLTARQMLLLPTGMFEESQMCLCLSIT